MKNTPLIHHLGIFVRHQLPTICQGYGQLLSFTNDGVSVYIFYRTDNPFYIERIGVQLKNDIIDLFECGVSTKSDLEAKSFATSFAEELVNYRRTFLEFRNTLLSLR